MLLKTWFTAGLQVVFAGLIVLISLQTTDAHQTDQAHAHEKKTNVTDASLEPGSTQTDPVISFVQADFEQKAQMLREWPYDDKSLEKLMKLMADEVLMKDASGKLYLINPDDFSLMDYQTGELHTGDWPPSIESVTLTTNLRLVLDSAQAAKNITSNDLSTRTQALSIIKDNLSAVSAQTLEQQLIVESDPLLKDELQALLARKQLSQGNESEQLKAVSLLAGSSNPDTLALIRKTLDQDQLSQKMQNALVEAESEVASRIKRLEWLGHFFSGLSMASILLLAALGLAITYGLLGVINMAHGELIMIGAYATYVTQSLFNSYFGDMQGYYLLAALPAAFLASAIVGMVIERLVVKPLYGRQLETLLATFGVSLVLIQIIRLTFGAQNVSVDSVGWLSGGVQLSSSVVLPYSRIAIICFTVLVLIVVKLAISYTRFGLFIRAVTQNRSMARAVGVRSNRVDMLAFGLGSGIAGLAGCALAQIGNVGPDLGQNLIVDTFLVVVVGGVGQLAGAALAAFGLGVGGTFLEIGFGAVLAKIMLLVLVILFIQKRPQGLFSVKGRFVDD